MHIDPYSNEVRSTVDLMLYYLMQTHPRRVRIASHSSALAQVIARRLCYTPLKLYVEHQDIQATLRETLAVEAQVIEQGIEPADIAIVPAFLEEDMRLMGEPWIVATCFNAWSYKNLLYPGAARHTIAMHLAALRSSYHLEAVAGLFSPRFLFWLTLAQGAERLSSAWYFYLNDYAMRRLIDYGPLWRLSYLVVTLARRK
jgi:hypothetical protein